MTDSIYDISVEAKDGSGKTLDAYRGEALLIVNVASQCGFTPQYAGLEQLNRDYGPRGLRVLGFPCNDFGGQEPGELGEIEAFCSLTYGVSFELFNKVHCVGDDRHPLYRWLSAQFDDAEVKWNFEKFLIAPGGRPVGHYSSKVTPDDPQLVSAIESLL